MRETVKNKLFRNILWALLPCLATVVLALAGGVKDFPFPDTTEYLELAQSLAHNFTFEASGVEVCRRTPGYPFCLMLFQWLGSYNFLLVNLLFVFGVAWFGMRLVEKAGIKYSWIFPVLMFLSPGMMTLSSVPLSEITFAFFLLLSIYFLINSEFVPSGLALSAAVLCRPIGIFLFLLFAAWMVWKKKKIVLILLFVACANLLPAFWMARNYVKYDYPAFTTLNGFNLLYFKAGSYLSWKNNVPFDSVRQELSERLTGDNIFERNAFASKLGRQILLDNFFGFCLWAPRDLVNFWMPDITPLFERLHLISGNRGTLDVLRRQGVWAAFKHYFNNNIPAIFTTLIYLVFYCLLCAAMAAGIIRLWLNKNYLLLVFGGLLIIYFWVLPLGNLDWRFRMPIMPLLFILAIYGSLGLPEALNWYKSYKKKN